MKNFFQLLDLASDGMALVTPLGRIEYSNQIFKNSFSEPSVFKDKFSFLWEALSKTKSWPLQVELPGGGEITVYQINKSPKGGDFYYFLLVKGLKIEKEHPVSEDSFPSHQEELGPEFQELVGEDPQFRRALLIAKRAAKSDLPVLITGESGTGKEILARAIHRTSRRREKALVDVNCAAIPESLIESELFGYERGAFTGARKEGRVGFFDLAHEGTIFLDEIGDASLQAQSKLLRVLEDGCFKRVGGNRNVTVDVRVISATNQDLRKLIAEKTFREDLYYRLNTFTIELPPLRERKKDIPLLVEHFLSQAGGEQRHMKFLPSTMDILLTYDWPGNVRELKGVVNYAINMSPSKLVTPDSLPRFLFSPTREASADKKKPDLSSHQSLPEILKEVERTLIQEALENSPNRSSAIKRLGISRRTFYQKLKEYHLG
ncbi:MAG: sigma 54-interacting transcriptional regulator [Syntrophales bacterium]|nr:sigma 54-interacting transcriptional regulator [Syntrophales bacterium]